jgi:hypothetical protein
MNASRVLPVIDLTEWFSIRSTTLVYSLQVKITLPAPPSGTDKCVLLGCLVHFFGKRADSENNFIFEHIF